MNGVVRDFRQRNDVTYNEDWFLGFSTTYRRGVHSNQRFSYPKSSCVAHLYHVEDRTDWGPTPNADPNHVVLPFDQRHWPWHDWTFFCFVCIYSKKWNKQGVVTCCLLKHLWLGSRFLPSKVCLIAWFLKGQRSNCNHAILIRPF